MRLKPALLLVLLSALARSADVVYPPDAGLINVKTVYGLHGDGVTDDTAALKHAVDDFFLTHTDATVRIGMLYFPNGTYLISDTILWREASFGTDLTTRGGWHGYLSFRGQSQANTIIKLKNSSTGYGSAGTPKAVLYTASEHNFDNTEPVGGGGDAAFHVGIYDMTIDTGTGNPGAIGVDYIGSNQSSMRNVTIRSGDTNGVAGLYICRNFTGPELFRNLTITGFDRAIQLCGERSSAVFEHISISGQHVTGFQLYEDSTSIRDLTSVNTVPAVSLAEFDATATILDSNFTGGSGGSAVALTGGARTYMRNVTTSGYTTAINDNGTTTAGPSISQYVSTGIFSSFTSPQASMNLPIQETPEFEDTNLAHWANVQNFGAVPGNNAEDGTAFQSAIDSGATTIYFPPGHYTIFDTVHLRGNVQRIIGYGVEIVPQNATCPAATTNSAFIFDGVNANTVTFENIKITGNFQASGFPEFVWPMFSHTGPQTAVFRNLMYIHYRNTAGSGPVFFEDTETATVELNNTTAWTRQLDPETGGNHILNNGSTLWILGLKTENLGTIITTINGGRTELLGAYISTQQQQQAVPPSCCYSGAPMFINTESNQSLIYLTGTGFNYTTQTQSTRGGVTISKVIADFPSRAVGTNMPLFVDYQQSATLPVLTTNDASSVTSSGFTAGGTITDTGGANILTKGTCYGLTAFPDSGSGTCTSDGSGSTAFVSTITGLQPTTLYNFRSYATNSVGIGFAPNKTVTTTNTGTVSAGSTFKGGAVKGAVIK